MPGQVKLAGIDLLGISQPHPAIIETVWEDSSPITYGDLPEEYRQASAAPANKIKIAALWYQPKQCHGMYLGRLNKDMYIYTQEEHPDGYKDPLLDRFLAIWKRADDERWWSSSNPEYIERYKLVKYLIILISRVFPVPLDSQYEKVAEKKRKQGGDPDALNTLVYFLENKVEIRNSFGAKSTIVQLDSNFRTIAQPIPSLDQTLKVFTIQGSRFTGTLFGMTIGLKPNTLEALIKDLLIEAHSLVQMLKEAENPSTQLSIN